MDLTEVEGLGDLIHAETSAQRRQAVRQMEGDLGNLYSDWRRQILKCLADVEAFIDFSEDENIEEDTLERATRTIQKVTQELHSHLSDNRRGERLRDGVHVAIIGEPNVGKSSLLNALCQRPAAIVSPIPGTTRDVVETQINLAGYPVLLSDTAGLRETSDVIEKEGVQRALGRASKADLKVLVLDASTFLQSKPPNVSWARFVFNHMLSLGLTPANSADNQQLQSLASSFNSPCNDRGTEVGRIQNAVSHDQELVSRAGSYGRTILHQKAAGLDYFSSAAEFSAPLNKSAIASEFTIDTRNATGDSRAIAAVCNSDVTISKDVIVAVNKCDLLSSERLQCVPVKNQIGMDICRLSCTAAGGLDTFVSLLAARVKQLCGDPLADSPSITQSRHRTHLTQCLFHLDVYLQQVNHGDTVLAAQALRRAMRDLGRITGAVNVEDVLEVIFKDFCIGK